MAKTSGQELLHYCTESQPNNVKLVGKFMVSSGIILNWRLTIMCGLLRGHTHTHRCVVQILFIL